MSTVKVECIHSDSPLLSTAKGVSRLFGTTCCYFLSALCGDSGEGEEGRGGGIGMSSEALLEGENPSIN